MKQKYLIVLIAMLFSACGNKSKTFVPERLLTEPEMINVMTDVQIIEADINYQKTQEREQNDSVKPQPKDFVKMSKDYYSQLFERYGITDSIFSQNIRYYTERPAVLEKIMDSVVQRLKREQTTSSTQ
ncbi:MAG: DUF4296 domain-containing protein [Bacteroidales bacterium]|nr:DUF4296 domain-containing protein [Bacteroidales bacterium]